MCPLFGGFNVSQLTLQIARESGSNANSTATSHRLFSVHSTTSRVVPEVDTGSTFKLVFPQNLYKLIDALLAAKHLVTGIAFPKSTSHHLRITLLQLFAACLYPLDLHGL